MEGTNNSDSQNDGKVADIEQDDSSSHSKQYIISNISDSNESNVYRVTYFASSDM
jgi:hypothetical protein